MHTRVKPNTWVVLRLPSGSSKVLQVVPNSIISLGKYGSFSSNHLLSRPYHVTYELLDRAPGCSHSALRIVPASELHADTIAEEQAANGSSSPSTILAGDGVEFQLVGEDGSVVMRSNRETIDDSARQTLTMEEIEELKREGTGAGKDLIAKLMLSHTGIEQKTAFSLAKYKLLKTKKYLRRFTLLPLDVPMLCHWMMEEKDAAKILEIREEMLALVGSWANVHYASSPVDSPSCSGGRWLVVDETGGLLVASMAERMGILYPSDSDSSPHAESQTEESNPDAEATEVQTEESNPDAEPQMQESNPDAEDNDIPGPRKHNNEPAFAQSNTITLLHANAQPNLSLLSYFGYTPNAPSSASYHTHPLATHLQPLSWLQLISPSQDSTYSTPPPTYTSAELHAMKSSKRATHLRKLRRYNRTKHIVDATHAGGFDGLAVAASMDPASVLRHCIPLLRGGAPIAVYSASIEPLVALADLYSTSRRTAFIQSPPASFAEIASSGTEDDKAHWPGDADFPLNPTLVLNASVQSARVRDWQVLPGRTHPLMTGRGGAEGYLFTGVRVRPAEGRVEARGKFVRKREREVKAEKGDRGEEVKEEQKEEEGEVQGGGEGEGDVEMADS